MVIGITGGIGSGKSTISDLLRSKGYPVFDTDYEARIIQNTDADVVNATKSLFGDDIYIDGQLNRPLVASLVFGNPDLLRKLMEIVHPAVRKKIHEWSQQFDQNQILFVESAVLFEGGFYKLMDKIVLIVASEEVRIERVMKRDNLTREQVIARIKNQIPDTEKIPESDLIINTDQGVPPDILSLIVIW
jgi:dephospho-CoA kinase